MHFYIIEVQILLTGGLILFYYVSTIWVHHQSLVIRVALQKALSLPTDYGVQGDCSPKMGAWSQAALISHTSHSFKLIKRMCEVEWKDLASGEMILNTPVPLSLLTCKWLNSQSGCFNYTSACIVPLTICNWYEQRKQNPKQDLPHRATACRK